MLRLACAIGVIAYIFIHSPERPAEPISADTSRWMERTRAQITEEALRSEVGRDLIRRGLEAHAKGGAR